MPRTRFKKTHIKKNLKKPLSLDLHKFSPERIKIGLQFYGLKT